MEVTLCVRQCGGRVIEHGDSANVVPILSGKGEVPGYSRHTVRIHAVRTLSKPHPMTIKMGALLSVGWAEGTLSH